jgi:hypothetical protein
MSAVDGGPANGRGGVGARLAWALVAVLAAFVLFWPSLGGIVAANDDIKFVRTPAHAMPLLDAIRDAWWHAPSFRPLEIAVGALSDPWTLSCGWVIAVHAAGLAVLAAAVIGIVRRAVPGSRVAPPLAIAWLLLSPPTTTSVWQMDCGSQTWSAAAGMWGVLLAWIAFDAAREGRVAWRILVALGVAFLGGCLVKETVYGWSASIGIACIVGIAWLARTDRAAALRFAWVLVPVVLVPVAELGARISTGALAGSTSSGPGDRYQAELGLNVVVNGAMSIAGSFANGPIHLVLDDDASPLLRLLPLVSVALVGGLLVVAAIFAWIHRGDGGTRALRPALIVAAIGTGSMVATVTMGSVSEIYCFGSNACIAVLVAAVLVRLWWPPAADEVAIGRTVACAAMVPLLAIGCLGVAGRAGQFRITWECARELNSQILAHERDRPAPPAGTVEHGIAYFQSSCIRGRLHSQYVLPPALAIYPDSTFEWLQTVFPDRPMRYTLEPPPGTLRPKDLLIDCSRLPERGHW